MNSKKYGNILVLIWGMLFCFTLIMCINVSNPSPFNWFLTGFYGGGFFMIILLNSIINAQDDLINILNRLVRIYFNKSKKKNGKRIKN